MKFLAIFMTVIMLFSGIDLCEDESAFNGVEETEFLAGGHEEGDDFNACSPFCSCTRCSFSIIIPKILYKPQGSDSKADKLVTTVQMILSPVSPSVWQPPKSA